MIPAGEAGAILTVDLGAIVRNWRALAARCPSAECAAVVKADAYGTGIETTVPALAAAGCRTFFVAHLSEGRRVRAVAPGAVVYVLNGLLPGTCAVYSGHNLRPVIGSLDEHHEWRAFMAGTGWDGGHALHVDTGMTRLGVSAPEARGLAMGPDRARPSLLMSHLACADDPGHPLNARQIFEFGALSDVFAGVPLSLCNSSGLFLPGPKPDHLVRPGAALYGVNPSPGRANPMEAVVSLDARIIMVRDVEPGETVGYGASWKASRRSRVAIVGVGYGDGFLRGGSTGHGSGAVAMAGDRRCPFAGRISMDLIAIDVTDALPLHRDDLIQLIGPGLTVDEVADRAGTIGYEILTGLRSRYHRRFVQD